MLNIKKDFPIFTNNPGLVFLDNAASVQKPKYVIDGVSKFLENDYANIHRGSYTLSHRSEDLYHDSKEIIANKIGGKSSEIIYTYNSTYAFNILAQSLLRSGMLKSGDKVLLSIAEHHANVVPWLMLKDYGIQIEYIGLDDKFDLDIEDFKSKYNDSVRLVSLSYASNVLGTIFDLEKIGSMLREDTYFAVDASQAMPNFAVDVHKLGADFVAFTGHKMMAYTGIGILWVKKDILRNMIPTIGGGGSIKEVSKEGFSCITGSEGFETGTPNLVGAVSMLKAIEYMDSIGGYEVISEHEKKLTQYALDRFAKMGDKITLVGKQNAENRLGVFSFVLSNQLNPIRIGEIMADSNVCIRCGGHCAHPLLTELGHGSTCRMSTYIYNDFGDIDRFFVILDKIV